jgi:putative flavoprotein involved in K+ transport
MEVDFRRGEVKTVVWATGFKPDYSWLKLPVYDRKGAIKHDGGAVVLPGVYTLGLTLMRSRKSSFIYGSNDDSSFVANHMREYLDYIVANERVLA